MRARMKCTPCMPSSWLVPRLPLHSYELHNGMEKVKLVVLINLTSNSNNFAAERKQPKDIFNRRKYVETKVIVKSVETGFELVQFNFLGKTVEIATTITIAIRTYATLRRSVKNYKIGWKELSEKLEIR